MARKGPAIIVIIVAAVAIGAAIMLLGGPDFDAIIENRDCGAAMKLTEAELERASVEQQVSLGVLLASCMLGGGR